MGRRHWAVFALAGAFATVLYVAWPSTTLTGVVFAVVGLGGVVAIHVGPSWHHAEPRRPLRWIAASSLVFLVGALVRPFVTDGGGHASLLADAFTVPGYLFIFVGLMGLLRARGSVEWHAVLDGLIVCCGAALATTLLLALPAAAIDGRPALVSVLAGLYPLFDVVLLLVAVNLTFTTAVWRPSFVMLLAMLVMLLLGDLAYAVIGRAGELTGSPLINVPFLIAYTLLGTLSLHPSVAELGQATRPAVQAWSWQRLLLLVPAMVVPFALLPVVAGDSRADRLILAAGGAVMTGLLIARAMSAVQGHVAAQRRSEHQAMHDPLTGLPNRRALSAQIEHLLTGTEPGGAEQVWVYHLDLDGFKWVNDSWGHDAGDQLILQIAARLRERVPAGATLARVGGDDFVVVHTATGQSGTHLVEVIMGALADPVRVRAEQLVISASVGISHAWCTDDPALVAEALLRDADTAMHQAKSEGRGRSAVFDASMHDRVRERVEIELALRTALTDEQFHLAYQPIVDLASGTPVGAEALLRWDHPTRGPVPPATVVPIAEDSGLITAIGTWVRQEAVRQLAAWRADGTVDDTFWISVNVSPKQLRDPHLADAVAAELAGHGVPPRCLVLEITESVMVDGSSLTDRVLFDLRAQGVRLVVDDFGTGFSALGYLRRFPLTGVKVDRSFVSGLGVAGEDEEIVRAVVAMSVALGLTVVAEGVETARQRDALASVGVTRGQGWLWGAAVPAPAFAGRWARPARHEVGQVAAGNS